MSNSEDSAVIRRPATLNDVAELAEVSPSTVSRALRGSTRVVDATRERVIAAAQTLNFSISRSASSLASGQTRRIAILVGGHLHPWFTGQILEGAYPFVRDTGYDMVIYRAGDIDERRSFFEDLPARRNADALIVMSFMLTEDEHARLDSLDMPIVYVNSEREGAATVSVDDVAGERQAVRHLLSLGHKRFGYVVRQTMNPQFVWSADTREVGFHAELTKAEIGEDQRVRIEVGDDDDAGSDAVAHILGMDDRPTALCVVSDDLAISVVHALRKFGISVPGDISVVGFDDIDLAGPLELTTIRQPAQELGAKAAELALGLATGTVPGFPKVNFPTSLVLRGTTGSVKA